MIFAILPVKSPRNAKQRLTGFLGVEERETLARTLYSQTLAALWQAEGIDRVVVATSDAEVAEHARSLGVLVFEEDQQVSHSVSADAACLRAMEMGASTVLLVPIDVPTVTPADFSRLAASAQSGADRCSVVRWDGHQCAGAHAARIASRAGLVRAVFARIATKPSQTAFLSKSCDCRGLCSTSILRRTSPSFSRTQRTCCRLVVPAESACALK